MRIKDVLVMVGLALPLSLGHAQTADTGDAGAPPPDSGAASAATLSSSAAELVRLAQGGTSQDVLLAYVQNATIPFSLTADQILYLRDLGIPSDVITAMLNRDSAMRNQPQTYNYNQQAYPPTVAPPAPEPAPEPAPGPAPVPDQAPPPVQPPAPVYVSSPPPDVAYFYNDLSPYGTWVNLEGVGWCWQPSVVVVNRGWQPYCDGGYWTYTDAGWFWQSQYSWGWAPFHYGRWYCHDRCGWVWLPDRVWGPSWVVWRTEGDACGWAPLPPHAVFDAGVGWSFNGVRVGLNFDFGLRPERFTFVHLGDFERHDLGRRRLAPVEVTKIYNRTTVINNYQVRNKTFVNEGIRVDRVAAATHTTIRAVPIRDVPAGSPRRLSAPAGGSQLAVYRPALRAPAQPVKMVAQKVDASHPVIQHTPMLAENNARRPVQAYTRENTAARQPNFGNYATSNNRQQNSPTPWAQTRSAQPASPAPSWQNRAPAASGRNEANNSPQAAQANPYYRNQSSGTYPSRNTGIQEPQPVPRNQGNQFYEPKSYRQASEIRALPPANTVRPTFAPAPARAPAQQGGQSRNQ